MNEDKVILFLACSNEFEIFCRLKLILLRYSLLGRGRAILLTFRRAGKCPRNEVVARSRPTIATNQKQCIKICLLLSLVPRDKFVRLRNPFVTVCDGTIANCSRLTETSCIRLSFSEQKILHPHLYHDSRHY